MIETVYSNENGDDRTSKAVTAFKMPKNIRQIGKSNATRKIYVEDYVMSFIKQLAGEDFSGCVIAVLVGQCIRLDGCRNIFVSGAVRIKDADIANNIVFTNDTWTGIYEDIKKYFTEMEIVGWYIGGPGYLLKEEDRIQKIHIDNFAGQDKVLLTYDTLEKEEAFFCYENSCLGKQEGYYIYYEKNEEMQNYIVEQKQPESCEAEYNDKISKDIRTVIQNKKPAEEDNSNVTRLMYAAGTLLAIIILIVGAAMLRNYDQMRNMQQTLNYLSKNIEGNKSGNTQTDSNGTDAAAVTKAAVTKAASADQNNVQDNKQADKKKDSLDVEVMPGNVDSLDDKSQSSSKDSTNQKNETSSNKDLAKGDIDTQDISDADAEDAAKEAESAKKEKNNKKTNTAKNANATKKSDNTKKAGTTSKKTVKQEYTYYTVKDGDTLADISYKLYKTYTRVKNIMELNGIEDQDLIYAGEKIKVP